MGMPMGGPRPPMGGRAGPMRPSPPVEEEAGEDVPPPHPMPPMGRAGRAGPPQPPMGRAGPPHPPMGRSGPPQPPMGRSGPPQPPMGRAGPPHPPMGRAGPARPSPPAEDNSGELEAERSAHEETKRQLADAQQQISDLQAEIERLKRSASSPAPKAAPPPMKAAPPKAAPPPAREEKRARALYDFNAEQDGDLGFRKGDIIVITKEDGAWWNGELNGHAGAFPSNYVQLI
eukprot:m51a1_g3839 hypothetical protein (231) ;mRNA; f:351100-351875